MKYKQNTNGKGRPATNGNALKKSAKTQDTQFSDLFHFRLNGRKPQCRKCYLESSYLSFDGLCVACEQQGEYVWREVLTPEQRARVIENPASLRAFI
jgi:hypothetical protein